MAGIAERLQIVIDANTGNAARDILKAGSAVESLAVSEDRATVAAAKLSKAYAQQAVDAAKLAGDTIRLKAAQEQLKQSTLDLSLANDKLKISSLEAGDAGTTMGSKIAAGLAAAGPAIAAAGIGKFLYDGVKGFEDLAMQVQKFQAVAGGTTQQASLLVGQTKALGVEPEVAMKAFQRFGASIGDGTTKLSEFGMQVAKNANGTTNLSATFDNLRVAYQNSSDAAEKDAIAKQLSLRAGTALVPLLSATKEQLQAINAETARRGGVLNQDDVNKAIALKIEMNQAKLAFQGLEQAAAQGLIPTLIHALNIVTSIVDKLHEANSFRIGKKNSLGDAIGKYVSGGGPFAFLGGGDKKTAPASLADVGTDSSSDPGNTQAEIKPEDRLTSSLRSEIDAQKGVRDARRSSEDALTSLTKATDEYDKLLKAGPVDMKAVAAAQKEIETASREVTRAVEAENRAQQTLNKARERASALDLEEAANKIALAGDEITTRKAAVGTAREELDKLEGSGAASPDEIAAARAKVKKANDEVTSAVDTLGRAQENQQKVAQKGTDMDPAVQSALDGVRNAHENVQVAVGREADAEEKMRTAQAGDPDFADKLAAARQRIADAHTAIADAQDRETATALALSKAVETLSTAYDGLSSAEIGKTLNAAFPGGVSSSIAAGNGAVPGAGLGPGSVVPAGAGMSSNSGGGTVVNVTVNTQATTGAGIAHDLAWSLAQLPPAYMATP